MRTSTDLAVVNTMSVYGGSFAKAIAEAFYAADDANFTKLKAALPELWDEYDAMATLIAKKRALGAR